MPDFREEVEAQMRPIRDLGHAALPANLAASIDALKVRDKLLHALGAIERTDSMAQAENVSSRAVTYAHSAMDHDGDLSFADWQTLDTHIRERIAAKRASVGVDTPEPVWFVEELQLNGDWLAIDRADDQEEAETKLSHAKNFLPGTYRLQRSDS